VLVLIVFLEKARGTLSSEDKKRSQSRNRNFSRQWILYNGELEVNIDVSNCQHLSANASTEKLRATIHEHKLLEYSAPLN
jgi:hypothetical protein